MNDKCIYDLDHFHNHRLNCNSLDVTSGRSRIMHRQTKSMIRTYNVKCSNGLSSFWIIFAILIDHIELYCQSSICIGDDRIWECSGNITAVRFDILISYKYILKIIDFLFFIKFELRSFVSLMNYAWCTYVHPVDVIFELIYGMGQKFNVTSFKMGLMNSDTAQFGSTNWREVGRMRKDNYPSKRNYMNVLYNVIYISFGINRLYL